MDQSMYNLNEVYNNNSAEMLIEKSFRRKVFLTVSFAHIIFIIGPFVWLGLWSKFYDKKPVPMQVSLVNLVPAGKKTDEAPGAPNTPKDDKKESKKEDKKEDKKEAPVEDESTVPDPPVKINKKAPVEKALEKPVEKPIEKPIEKETVKVPTEKPVPAVKTTEKPVEAPKKSDLKKPSEIVKSDKIVKGKNPTPAPPKISGTDLAAKLKKIQSQCKITDTVGNSGAGGPGAPGGIGAPNGVGTVPAGYYETVSIYLYDLWKQPGKAELKGLKPTVTVHVSIDASGNIKSAKIVRKSNNLPMDASVEELLAKLKKLPPPPQGALELDVSLEIDENP
jgi:TonB family protein